MEKRTFLSKYLPHIIALVSFIIICAVYFKPQYDGMALHQSDMVQYSGMNQDIREHEAQFGENPGWAGRMFSGMPSYLIDFDYSGRLIRDWTSFFYFMGQPASYIFLAMIGFYMMLFCFRVNPWLSIVGALAYGLSTYFFIIIDVGHITKMVALAFAPPMVGGIYLAYHGKMWLGAAIAGFFASLEIAANHLQITYYFLFIVLALIINEFISAYKCKVVKKFFTVSAVLLAAGLLAIGSNINQLWYINDYSKDSTRGVTELVDENTTNSSGLDFDYATGWSYGKVETFNLFIPNFTGGSSAGGFSKDGPVANALIPYNSKGIADKLPGYWGVQISTSGPVYIGAVIIFLFVFSMFILCGRKKWWLFSVTVLCILLAWGHNFTWFSSLFFDYFPYYNKFRTVSMILVIAEWTVPLLGVLALQKLWNGGISKEKFIKSLKYSTIITGGTALFFLLFGGMIFDFSSGHDSQFPADIASAMRIERASLLRMDSLRSLIYVLLSAAGIWLFYFHKIKKPVFVALFAILILFDQGGVDRRYLNYDNFIPKVQATTISPTQADLMILEDKELGYRVANFNSGNPFQDATTSYFHRSVGGYHAAKMGRYQDLIENHLYKMNWKVYDMLNTKYIITQNEVQVNPNALGPAWFVDNIRFVNNAREEIDALDDFTPENTAVLDKMFFEQAKGGSSDSDSTEYIRLTDYKVNHLTYSYHTTEKKIAVFSEIYYPKGWTAYIDGNEASHFRANYVLRAMNLPAGQHTVEFIYNPPKYTVLKNITLISSLILLFGFLSVAAVYIVKGLRSKNLHNGIER
ncbi:MAG: YfhO family protein [Rikenellaceae bacterium]|nr:YfhO family protein [Rikenellaceae bacterium]